MRTVHYATIAVLLMPAYAPAANVVRPLPRLGMCARSTIKEVTQRLGDRRTHQAMPNSGSAMVLNNGVLGVSYDQVPALNESKAGDPVYTCLVKLPRNCPPGDHRGKIYTTTNLRTENSWTLPDAEHSCGGA